jgi:hypothetical protein
MKVSDMERDARGELPAYTWPGGYPLLYLTEEGIILCPSCASKTDTFDPATTGDVYWEGPAITCEECNADIDSAYGDPEETDSSKKFEALLSERFDNV